MKGNEFISRVSDSLGQELKLPRWVELLYDTIEAQGERQIFEGLAFEGKSFQRLNRLLSTGISDEAAKQKIEAEIRETLKRFLSLLEESGSELGADEKEEFRKQFLSPVVSSFDNVITLIGDFSKIKDYYLRERDLKDRS